MIPQNFILTEKIMLETIQKNFPDKKIIKIFGVKKIPLGFEGIDEYLFLCEVD